MSLAIEGVVERVSLVEEEDGERMGSITIRHGPKPRKDKDGAPVGRFPETTHLSAPNERTEEVYTGSEGAD